MREELQVGYLDQEMEVIIMPTGLTSKIKEICTFDGNLKEAYAPMSVAMTLEDDIDLSRGNMIVKANKRPEALQTFDAMLCWLHNAPARPRTKYTIVHTSNEQKAMITEVVYKIDINTYSREKEDKDLNTNDIARIKVKRLNL